MVAPDDDPFVDLSLTATTARAILDRAHAERLCAGHFPGDPVLPGAFLAGLLADLGACLVATSGPEVALAEVVRCVFRRRVRPDDDIVLVATRDPAAHAVEACVRTSHGIAATATLRFVTR